MTAWQQFSPADFDKSRATRAARARNAEQGGLFFAATPTVPAKPAPVAEQLPGQGDLFGGGEDDGPCPCGDCRPDAYPPETMRPGPGHWECCGQAHKGPCCQRAGQETAR